MARGVLLVRSTMWETEKFDVAERVAMSKARLSEKLSELARRVDTIRDKTAVPMHIVKRPWFVALAGVAGFLIGRRVFSARRALPPGVVAVPSQKSIPRAVILEVLVAAAGAMTRRYISKQQSQSQS